MRTPRLASAVALSALVLAAGGVASADVGRGAMTGADPAHAAIDKLDSGLRLLASAAADGKPVDESTGISSGGLRMESGARVEDGDALVNVYVDGSVPAAAAALHDLGMRITATSDLAPQRVVAGWLPAGSLVEAAQLDSVRAIVVSHGMTDAADGTDTGAVLSQGDAAHHGPQARTLGTTGAGVKVGVISDSINQVAPGVAGSQGTGDLPPSVTVLQDDPGSSDEGRAMAEIIYDEAPGITQMYFSTGTISAAGKATSINNLVAQGVKVIADDIFYPDEPMFQDGIVSQAVDAAKAAGVTYLASAGNRARQSWEGTLTGATEDFDPGPGVDNIQTLGTFSNRNMFVALQWAEPWTHATTDLALDIYDGATLAFTVNTNNITSGLPIEVANIGVPAGNHAIGIAVRRVAGTGTPLMKTLIGGTPTFAIAEFPTNSNAINPDAASAAGSLAVAASNFSTPTTPEAFSSRGPSITRLFDKDGNVLASPVVRTKPVLAAADGVATDLPAGGLNPFFGTSAATPSAAGIAVLMRSARPSLTVDQVATIMTNPANALDCTATAGQPDPDCGAGFLMADRAVQALDTSPPTVTGALSPAAPSGVNGWYTGPVTLTWTVADPQTAVQSQTGCGPAAPPEGTTTITCVAKSIGGSATGSVTVKRDSTAPTKVKVKGLKKSYAHGTKPVKKKVKCKATDTQSGIASCKVKGLKTTPGKHTVTVTATNTAGLVTTTKFKYTIH